MIHAPRKAGQPETGGLCPGAAAAARPNTWRTISCWYARLLHKIRPYSLFETKRELKRIEEEEKRKRVGGNSGVRDKKYGGREE